MTEEALLSITIAVIITFCVFLFSYISMKRKETTRDNANTFLEGFANSVLDTIHTIVYQFDPSLYKNVDEFEIDVLNKIYDTMWDYLSVKSQEAYYDNLIVKAVLNTIDREFVMNFVKTILSRENIYSFIRSAYAAPNIESGDIEEEDKKLSEEYSNQKEYFEVVEPCDLPPVEKVEIDDSNLNPQKDDGEPIEEDDESIEEITPESVIVKKDKNGNLLYYLVDENNKKKRISKEDALLLGYSEE